MGMHESGELREVVDVLYDQFLQIKLSAGFANIMIFNEENCEIATWLSESEYSLGGNTCLFINGKTNPTIQRQWDIWNQQQKGDDEHRERDHCAPFSARQVTAISRSACRISSANARGIRALTR